MQSLRRNHARRLILALPLLVALPASAHALPGSTSTDPKAPLPWEDGQGMSIVTKEDGREVVVWPVVLDAYIDEAPVSEILRWVLDQWSEEARTLAFRSASQTNGGCVPISLTPKRQPLSDDQWHRIELRVAAALRDTSPDVRQRTLEDLRGLWQIPGAEPDTHNGRAEIGEALWSLSSDRDLWKHNEYPIFLGTYAGDAGLLGRMIDRYAASKHTAERAFLGDAFTQMSYDKLALTPAESSSLAAAMLELAAEPTPKGTHSAILRATAAFRIAGHGPVALTLVKRSLDSEHAMIRVAALMHTRDTAVLAAQNGDHPTLSKVDALRGRIVEIMLSDPDTRAASRAVGTLWAIAGRDPERGTPDMIRGLDSHDPMTIATVCMYMMERPELARPAETRLQEIAASGTPDAAEAAAELLQAMK